MSCLFCRIIAGDIPSKIAYQDDAMVAFHDVNPQAPVHVLIVPRRHIATLNDLGPDDELLIWHDAPPGRSARQGTRDCRARLSHRVQLQQRGRSDGVPSPSAPARRTPDALAARVAETSTRTDLFQNPFSRPCQAKARCAGDHRADHFPGSRIHPSNRFRDSFSRAQPEPLARVLRPSLIVVGTGEQVAAVLPVGVDFEINDPCSRAAGSGLKISRVRGAIEGQARDRRSTCR